MLRLTFKSLSNKVKHVAMRDEDANMVIKAWYSEHFDWAAKWLAMKEPIRDLAMSRQPPQPRSQFVPSADQSTINTGGKGPAKRAPEPEQSSRSTKAARPDNSQSGGNMVECVQARQAIKTKGVS